MTTQNQNSTTCRWVCILVGLAAAALAWFFLNAMVSTLPLAIIAFFTFLFVAWALYEAFCKGASDATTTVAATGAATAAVTAASLKSNEPKHEEPVSSFTATPDTKSASQNKPATRKASAKKPAAKSAKAAPAKKAPAKKTAVKKAPAKKVGPERLKQPKGKADDLKLISGVGPKLEKTLNGLGFWHFEQLANWKKADVAIVDDELSFKGRIERDDWIKQAKALAKGGEAEYIKVFGKKPR